MQKRLQKAKALADKLLLIKDFSKEAVYVNRKPAAAHLKDLIFTSGPSDSLTGHSIFIHNHWL